MHKVGVFALSILLGMSKAHAVDPVTVGFSINGSPINPKCIQIMQPWMSDNGTSIRQVVLDECQNSNLAFKGLENQGRSGDQVYFYETPNDAHTFFGYEVIGVTENDLFVLSHSGDIGLYQIREEKLFSDILKRISQSQKILTYMGASPAPCLVEANVQGTWLIHRAKAYDPNATGSQKCSGSPIETRTDLSFFSSTSAEMSEK